jgi:hypothetical protein
MRLPKATIPTSPQWDQSRKWAVLLFIGFLGKYAYTIFQEVDYATQSHLLKNFYPWMSAEYKIPLMDWRNYVYLIGERFFIMVLFYIISRLMYCWQTILIWFLSVLYVVDFVTTFHASIYGSVMVSVIGILFITTIWKTQFLKMFGSLYSYWRS